MRIAHITDFHLRQHQPGTAAVAARRSREMAQRIPEALERIRLENPDFLAVTGDLLDVPTWLYDPTPGFDQDDVKKWEKWVEEDYRLIKGMLDQSEIPYLVLPGNHDWDEVFWRVFDPSENTVEIGDIRFVRFCDYEHAGHVPRRFYPERSRFESELSEGSGRSQVHLQHYVITPELNRGYPHSYAESLSLVRQIAEAGNVKLCLSGHFHKGTELLYTGSTCFTTGSAFCEAPFPWRIYELENETVTLREESLEPEASLPRPVVFLDRDGVINDKASYCQGPEAMRLLPRSARAIRLLRDAGYAVVVVTNQSCVGYGYVPEGVMYSVNDKMCRLLQEEAEADVDAIYAATAAGAHAVLEQYEDPAECKPSAMLLERAREQLNLQAGGWMVGDRIGDAQAARAAGIKPILVRSGGDHEQEKIFRSEFPEEPVVDDLFAAVELIQWGRGIEADSCNYNGTIKV